MNKIYFVERRLNNARLKCLKSLAKSSGLFHVCEYWNDALILLFYESTQLEAIEFLKKKDLDLCKKYDLNKDSLPLLIDLAWFHQCIRSKTVISTNDFILNSASDLKSIPTNSSCDALIPNKKQCLEPLNSKNHFCFQYACETKALLNHHNKKFCDALEILELHALYRGDNNSESRALAFRRGSASLKSYDKEICEEFDLVDMPLIGQKNSSKPGHCKKIIIEILSKGFSDEVVSVINSDFFQTMKIFCGIFGVGPSTAQKWYYDCQFRSLDDVRRSKISLTQYQIFGLQYYEDLNTSVKLKEAEYILKLVQDVCHQIDNSVSVTLAGGFRRGKTEGHDVDLLISGSSSQKYIISKIINDLQDNFIYADRKMSGHFFQLKETHSSTMDHFDKCFTIFKFNNNWLKNPEVKKHWKAVRLDLVFVPVNQFAFALLGWTGSKHFEREIRRYARAKKNIILTSHAMHKLDSNESINASSEQEIFEALDLSYRHPCERCF